MTNTHASQKRNLRSRASRALVGLTAVAVLAPLGATAFATAASAATFVPPTSHTCGYPPTAYSLVDVPDVSAQERASFSNIFSGTAAGITSLADLAAGTVVVTVDNDDPSVLEYTFSVNGQEKQVVNDGSATLTATFDLKPGEQNVFVGGYDGTYGAVNARQVSHYVGNAAQALPVTSTCMPTRFEGPERVTRVLWTNNGGFAPGSHWSVEVKDSDGAVTDTFETRSPHVDLTNYPAGEYSYTITAYNADNTPYRAYDGSTVAGAGSVHVYTTAAAPTVSAAPAADSDDVELTIETLVSSQGHNIGGYSVFLDRDGDGQYYGKGETLSFPNSNPGEDRKVVLRDLPAGEAYSVFVTADHSDDYGTSPAARVDTDVIVEGDAFTPATVVNVTTWASNIANIPVQVLGFDGDIEEDGTEFEVIVNGDTDVTLPFDVQNPFIYDSSIHGIAGQNAKFADLSLRRVVQGIPGAWSAPVTVYLDGEQAPVKAEITHFTAGAQTYNGTPYLTATWDAFAGAHSYELVFDQGTAKEKGVKTNPAYYSSLTSALGLDAGEHTVTVRALDGADVALTPFAAPATVIVPVASTSNTAPVLGDDEATVTVGDEVVIDVMANDTDADNDYLILSEVWGATNGYAYVKDGKVNYTSNPDFAGTETLTYRVTDGTEFRDATITVVVTPDPDNHVPVANDDTVTFTPGDVAIFDVISNDTDADGDQLYVYDVTQPAHGSAGTVNGGIGYNPTPGFVGTDELTYTVTDGKATSTGKLTIVVKPKSAPPVTTPPVVTPPITTPPVTPPTTSPEVPGNPVVNRDGSTSYTSPSGQDVTVKGAILDAYKASGASGGDLGVPTTNELTAPDGKGKYTHFENGSIYWTPTTGAHAVVDEVHALWSAKGWENGLGYPTSDQVNVTGGTVQRFTGGLIYTNAAGTHEVHGAIASRYAGADWERSRLGGVVTNENATPDGVGRYNHFEGGSIYWTPATGAQMVYGEIKKTWSAAGWEKSSVGFPAGEEFSIRDGGRVQRFTGGLAYWSKDTGAHLVSGAFGTAFAAQGWENGKLGYPTSGEYKAADGTTRQNYQGGVLVWDGSKVTRR